MVVPYGFVEILLCLRSLLVVARRRGLVPAYVQGNGRLYEGPEYVALGRGVPGFPIVCLMLSEIR